MKTKQIILIAGVFIMGILSFWLWYRNAGVPEYDINQQIDPNSNNFQNWENNWEEMRQH